MAGKGDELGRIDGALAAMRNRRSALLAADRTRQLTIQRQNADGTLGNFETKDSLDGLQFRGTKFREAKGPSGNTYKEVPLDKKVQLREGDRFITLQKPLVEHYGLQQMMEFAEVQRAVEADITLTGEDEYTPEQLERIFARVDRYKRINLPQALCTEYPRLKGVLDDAKMFSFGQDATERVVELSQTDWREWLPRALNPFPLTLFEFNSDHFRMTVRNQGPNTTHALEMFGVTGALIVGGHIIPLHKIMSRANPMIGYAYLPSIGARVANSSALGMLRGEFSADDGDLGPRDVLQGLWGDAEYVAKYGMPEGYEHFFLPAGAAAAMRWEQAGTQLHLWSMAVNQGAIRRALAAMALVNSDRQVIELGQAGGRQGRTVLHGKTVPRYTLGPVRILPEQPRVERERAEPDPDRPEVHKALHDVRSHTRTYHKGTDKEFTIRVSAHQRGDAAYGDLTGPGRTYAVGEDAPPIAIAGSAEGAVAPADEAPVQAPNVDKQEWAALILSSMPRLQPRPVLAKG